MWKFNCEYYFPQNVSGNTSSCFLFFSFVFVQSAGRHRPTGCDSDSLVQDQDWNPAAVSSVSRTFSVSIKFKYLSNYLGSLSG